MPSQPPLTVTIAVRLDDPGHRRVQLDVSLHAGSSGGPGHRQYDAEGDHWGPAPCEAAAEPGMPPYAAELVMGTSATRWPAVIGRTWPRRLAIGVVAVVVLVGLVLLFSPTRGPQAEAVPPGAATTTAPDPWAPSAAMPVCNADSHTALEADRACMELINRVALAAGWSSATPVVPG